MWQNWFESIKKSISPVTILPAGVALFFSWYYLTSKEPTIISYGESSDKILKKCTKIHKPYYSTFWMLNNHVHTILSEIIHTYYAPQIKYER